MRSERRLSDLELHHVYPLQFLDRFERVGIDPEDYMVYLYQSQHRLRPHGLHTGSNNWNAQWAQFFKKNENQSADLIAEQLINMFKQLAK